MAGPGVATVVSLPRCPDATDVANYILNLPPKENMIPNGCVAPGP